MKEARDLMVEHCRGPYRIVEEGGQTDEGSWTIQYRCGTKAAPTAAPAGDATPVERPGR